MSNQFSDDSPAEFHRGDESSSKDASFVSKLPDGNLLSQIIGFSEKDSGSDEELEEIRNKLKPVLDLHADSEQLSEPILRELIEAMLPQIQGMSKPLTEQLTSWVAKTLFQDVHARVRLERLWRQLKGRQEDGLQ